MSKSYGKLRACRVEIADWHGMRILPGMWYGEDRYGYYATYGDKRPGNGKYNVIRASRKNLFWLKRQEDKTSDLTAKLNELTALERQQMQELRELDEQLNGARRRAEAAKEAARKASAEAKQAKKARRAAARKAKDTHKQIADVSRKLDARTSLADLKPYNRPKSKGCRTYKAGAYTGIEVTSNPRESVYMPERILRQF